MFCMLNGHPELMLTNLLQFCRVKEIFELRRTDRNALRRKIGAMHLPFACGETGWKTGTRRNICNSKRSGREPARDLLARVPPGARHRLVDLGCGPGNSTELLARGFPEAEVSGVDTSEDMLAGGARAVAERARFEKGDVARWRSEAPPDLIFANALLQWVPGHIDLMTPAHRPTCDGRLPGGPGSR